MTSRAPQQRPRRRSAEDRRAEILAEASRMAVADGLDTLTLRSIADALGITGGLVGHYFPSVDALLAAAFGAVAEAELEEVFEGTGPLPPVEAVRTVLGALLSADRDRISLLWLDAWHAGRSRPLLRAEVVRQTEAWTGRLASLLEDGRAAGVLTSPDTTASATRIIAVVDGLSVQATMRDALDLAAVAELVVDVAERELGLPAGTLAPGPDPDAGR